MILCCGEALIDMIPAQMADPAQGPSGPGQPGFVPIPGGAVFNTAIALGRLEERVGLLSGLSGDLFGQQLVRALRDSHVDSALSIFSDRPTTLAFVQLEDGHASYSFFDENSAGRMLRAEDMPDLPADVTALFFGGISLVCEPGADAYAALLTHEAEGRAVMLDPNIRPGFITDAARYRARLGAMIAQADILKLSDEDLDWILPEPAEPAAKAAALLAQGPSVVVITRGGGGATGYLRGGIEISVPAVPTQVVDTVGAGDAFNAGVLASLSGQGVLDKAALRHLSREALAMALTNGARVASVTVSRSGANPPWKKEL